MPAACPCCGHSYSNAAQPQGAALALSPCSPLPCPPVLPDRVLPWPADIGMEEAGLAEAVAQAVQGAHPHLHALLYSNVLLTGGLAVRGGGRAGSRLGLGMARGPPCTLDCSMRPQIKPAHDVPCCGCTRLPCPALPCPAGGTARCPGFRERLYAELRPLVPDDYEVRGCDAPVVSACICGHAMHACAHVVCLSLCVGPACPPTHPPTHPSCLPQLCIHLAEDPVLCAWKGAALLAASPQYPQLAVTQQEWRQQGAAALAKWDT